MKWNVDKNIDKIIWEYSCKLDHHNESYFMQAPMC